jgi:hypothetical protein
VRCGGLLIWMGGCGRRTKRGWVSRPAAFPKPRPCSRSMIPTGRWGWILSSRGLEETQVDEVLELLPRADFGDEGGDFTSST